MDQGLSKEETRKQRIRERALIVSKRPSRVGKSEPANWYVAETELAISGDKEVLVARAVQRAMAGVNYPNDAPDNTKLRVDIGSREYLNAEVAELLSTELIRVSEGYLNSVFPPTKGDLIAVVVAHISK